MHFSWPKRACWTRPAGGGLFFSSTVPGDADVLCQMHGLATGPW